MYRLLGVLGLVAAILLWTGATALAQRDNEFQLPPVKLKPDRPTTAKPIPPVPDDREAPKPPAETPKEPEPAPPPPVVKPPVLPPAEAPKEPAPPPQKPVKAPREKVEKPAPAVVKPTKMPAPAEAPKGPPEPAVLPPMPPPPPEIAKPTEVATPSVPAKAPKPEDVQKEAAEAQVRPLVETDLAGLGEVGLAEEVARTRKAYARALLALKDLYASQGSATKSQWVDEEIAAFEKVPKTQYLSVSDLAGPNLRPIRRIDVADQLFEEGIQYKNYPAFPPGKKDYLKIALEKFQTIIEKYPESDKIDDAAFRMGEIYGGWYFEDWARAVQCYQRCWEWNPQTDQPALFNAAKIYEDKLKNRAKAVELYNRVVAEYPNEDTRKQAVERIKAITGK
jgi:hypothetical protein